MAKKDKPKYVYVVTRGDYSDYHIVGAFASRYLANKYIKDRRIQIGDSPSRGNMTIEKYPLNNSVPSLKTIYRVSIDEDGQVVERSTDLVDPIGPLDDYRIEGKTWDLNLGTGRGKKRKAKRGIEAFSFRGYDVATKIARDKLAEVKAKEAGII